MKKRAFLAIIITTVSSLSLVAVHAATFPDVREDHFAYHAIEYFASKGVLSGYKDAATNTYTFQPDKNVNRAEAVKMMLAGSTKTYNVPTTLSENVFPDVQKNEWFAPFVYLAKKQGIVKGNDNTGIFDPGRTVNKVELLKMVLLANEIDFNSKLKGIKPEVSSDVDTNAWYFPYMLYAKEYGIIVPDHLGKFNPGKQLSRGEVAEIMFNIHKIVKGGTTQEYLSRAESKIYTTIGFINTEAYAKAKEDMVLAKGFMEKALSEHPNELIIQEGKSIIDGISLAVDAYYTWKVDGNLEGAKDTARKARQYADGIIKLDELANSLETLVSIILSA